MTNIVHIKAKARDTIEWEPECYTEAIPTLPQSNVHYPSPSCQHISLFNNAATKRLTTLFFYHRFRAPFHVPHSTSRPHHRTHSQPHVPQCSSHPTST